MNVLKVVVIYVSCMLRMNMRHNRVRKAMVFTAMSRMDNRRHHVWSATMMMKHAKSLSINFYYTVRL